MLEEGQAVESDRPGAAPAELAPEYLPSLLDVLRCQDIRLPRPPRAEVDQPDPSLRQEPEFLRRQPPRGQADLGQQRIELVPRLRVVMPARRRDGAGIEADENDAKTGS